MLHVGRLCYRVTFSLGDDEVTTHAAINFVFGECGRLNEAAISAIHFGLPRQADRAISVACS